MQDSGKRKQMSDETIQATIANLQAILDSGATTVTEDGETVAFDADAARRRIRELRAQLTGARSAARRIRTLDLRDAF